MALHIEGHSSSI